MHSLGTGCFPLKGICCGGAQVATIWKTSAGSIAFTLNEHRENPADAPSDNAVYIDEGHKRGMGEFSRDGGVQQSEHESEIVVIKAGSMDVHDHWRPCLSSRISVVLNVQSSKSRSDELRSCGKPPSSEAT